jgi:hypothetical protein
MKMIEENSPSGLSRKITQSVTGTVEPQVKDVLDYSIEELRDYTRSLEPHYERGTPEYYAHAAILSLGQNVIPITVGTLTGGSALPLFMMGAQSAGSKYNDLLENGMESGKASVVAGMYGAAEVIGEKVSIGKLIKGSPLSRIILGTAYDIPGELLTEVLQAGIDGGILGEDDAFNLDRFIDTAIITGISSPFLGAGSASISKLAKRKGIPAVAREDVPAEAANLPAPATETTDKQTAGTAPEVVQPEQPIESLDVIEERAYQEILKEIGQEAWGALRNERGSISLARPSIPLYHVGVEIKEGMTMIPDHRGLVWFSTSKKKYGANKKGTPVTTINIPPDKLLVIEGTDGRTTSEGQAVISATKSGTKDEIFAEAEKRGYEAVQRSYDVSMRPETVDKYIQKTPEQIASSVRNILNEKGFIDVTPIVELGRSIYEQGATTYERFVARIKDLVGDAWESVKKHVKQAWNLISGERGSVSFKKLDTANMLEDPLAQTMSKEEFQEYRRRGVTEGKLEYLEKVVPQIEKALRESERETLMAFRAGENEGAIAERERQKELKSRLRNYSAFVGEARAIKKWLRERATDFVKSKGMSPEFRDAIQGVINFDSSALKSLITANPEDIFIDEEQIELLDRTTEQDLSLDELRNVKSIIKQIRHQGVIAKQAEVKGEKILRSVLIDDVNNEILDDWGLKDAMDDEQAKGYLSRSHEKLTKSNRVMSILNKVKSAVTKAETVFDVLGSKKLRDATFEEIARSERVKLKVARATDERLSKAFNLIKEDIENDWNKIKAFGNVNISTRMALAVALNSQREVNRRSLHSVLTDQQIDSIVDALSPNQTAFVEQIWKTLEYQQPMISDAYRRLTGERLKLDEGRYYPNMPDVSESDILSQKKADQDLLQDFGSVTSVARGFTKKARGANVPPILDPLRIIGHIDSVNHFIAYGNSVRSVNRIINDTAFKKTASFVMNDEIPNVLNGWLKSVANPRTDRDIDGLKQLRNNVTMSMLGVKLSTSILQFTAIFQALPRIGIANFARYSPEFFANPLKTSRIMYEKSAFLADRRGKLDVSLAEMVGNKMDDVGRKMGLSKRAIKRMREVGMFPIQITDAMATLPVWWTAYGTKLAESGNEVEAVEHADKIVRQTASSTSTKDLAKVQKGAWKNVFMFYSYASTTLNEQLKDNAEFRKAWRRGDIGTGLRDWTYGTFMRYMAPALIIGTLKGLATGGDDEDAEESVTKGVANEIIQNVFGGLGPLYGVYQGVMSERPTGMKVSATQGVVEDIRNLKQGFFSDKIWEGRGLAPQWRGLIGVGGAFLGLPAKQTTLLLDEAIDAQENGEISTKNITGLVWANKRKKD